MDRISKQVRSRNMAAIKSKDTTPEMAVRKLLYSLGSRYRLHRKDLPGKPDIFLKSRNSVIFVHGCFWHQHPNCKYAAKPKSHRRFWGSKLRSNIKRDKYNFEKLRKLGYRVITIWECEVKKASDAAGYDRLIRKLKRLLK